MTTNLFVYGSLMNEEVVTALLGRSFSKTKALLADYKCVAVSDESYPGVRPESGYVVNGELLEGLTVQQLECLDLFEGEYYQRISVVVVTDDNNKQQCDTYVFKPDYYDLLTDRAWSNKQFREKHLQAFINEHGLV